MTGPDAGLGQVDLSVRVLQEMGLHLGLQLPDLLVQGDQHSGGGLHGSSVGGGDRGGLGQLGDAERVFDHLGPGGHVAAAGPLERGADLGGRQLRRSCRGGRPGQQLQGVGGGEAQVRVGRQGGGEELPQRRAQPQGVPGAFPDQRLVRAGDHLDGLPAAVSAATARSWCRSARIMSARACASAASLLAPERL